MTLHSLQSKTFPFSVTAVSLTFSYPGSFSTVRKLYKHLKKKNKLLFILGKKIKKTYLIFF